MTMTSMKKAIVAVACVAWLGACGGGAGLSQSVRSDIVGQMDTAREPMGQCYADALKRDDKVDGLMVVAFKVAPGTGQFEGARVVRSNVRDAEMEQCVLSKLSTLKLAQPQSTVVGVDSYPIKFAPAN